MAETNNCGKYTITLTDEEVYEFLVNMKEAMKEELGVKISWNDVFRKAFNLDEVE